MCEAVGVIRISDDSSTESDAGLDSDFHSSPESLDDDVVIVDAVGLPTDDRGEARGPAFLCSTAGAGRLPGRGGWGRTARKSLFTQPSGVEESEPGLSTPRPSGPGGPGAGGHRAWGCGRWPGQSPLTFRPCRPPWPPAAGPERPRRPGTR